MHSFLITTLFAFGHAASYGSAVEPSPLPEPEPAIAIVDTLFVDLADRTVTTGDPADITASCDGQEASDPALEPSASSDTNDSDLERLHDLASTCKY